MAFELIPSLQLLQVEGHSDAPGVGDFSGAVIAIGLRGSDPVAAAATEQPEPATDEPEGLLGWGTTYFLVADPSKPAPIWVAKGEVTAHRLEPPR